LLKKLFWKRQRVRVLENGHFSLPNLLTVPKKSTRSHGGNNTADLSPHITGENPGLDLAEQDRQLAKLPVATGAAFSSYHRQHEPQCTPDTRVELLGQLQKWSYNQDKYIFWLGGLAGTGKSTVARTAASSFSSQKRLGASFFFSRGGGDLGNAAKFVSTLAYQLANLSVSFKRLVCEAIAEQSGITQQGLRNQWEALILRPLSKLSSGQSQLLTLVFVVDALDECDREEDIKLILQLFVEVKDLNTVRLRIFVTSRPETAIRFGFRDMPEIIHQDLLLHDIPRSIVEHDISVFVIHELSNIKKQHNYLSEDWPDNKDVELLVQRSDCLFIYAATACRFVGDQDWPPEDRLSLILQGDATGESPTANLDNMYTQVLQCSVIKNRQGKEKAKLSERFKQIVGSIILLFDVLSVVGLAKLLSTAVANVDIALSPLHSVLNISTDRNASIRLLHPSFRDFLLDNTRCPDIDFWTDQEIGHMKLAENCLRLMSDTLKKDICNLRIPGTLIHEVQIDKINLYLPKYVQYSCRYWVDHLGQVSNVRRNEIGLRDDGQIHNFLKKHFLHWLEALSLMGKMPEGVLMVTKLESMLKASVFPALKQSRMLILFNF
jgi:hypothetical protein